MEFLFASIIFVHIFKSFYISYYSFGPDGIVVQGVFPDDIWVKRGLMAAVLLLTTIISIVGPGAFGKVVLGFLAIVCICTFTVIWSYFGFFTKR